MLQVYCRAPSRSIEASSRICLRNSREVIFQLIILLHVYYARHFLRWHLPFSSLWGPRAPHEWCHVTYPLSDHGLGESYSARVVNRSIGCSHPGTWRILVSDQSSSCLYQLPHCLFHDGVTQGVTRIRDRYSTCLCREPCLHCLTHFSRRQELHRGLPTRNIPCRYHFLHGRCQRHLFRSLFVILSQALNFLTLLFVAVFKQLSSHVSIFLHLEHTFGHLVQLLLRTFQFIVHLIQILHGLVRLNFLCYFRPFWWHSCSQW